MEAPKYEVIADYPRSHFLVGKILELEKWHGDFVYFFYDEEGRYWMSESEFDEYPHLFKKL